MAIKKKTKKSGSKPTNPSLYSRVKSEAKRKFDVYPSAYANGHATSVCMGEKPDLKKEIKVNKNYMKRI